ncbi:MAG: hypothetical protein KAH68_04965 [Draconibacterium sp.]|nr:hypothetical protein [Draconibacterium sp.]
MKKLALISLFALILFSCGNQKSKKQSVTKTEPVEVVVVLTVDELYKNAAEFADKEVVVKGTVMHVCKSGGGRCFIMGSNEDINIRIEAGEKIGAFDQELMGSDIEVVGIFREVKTEADAHNPENHGEGEHAEEGHEHGDYGEGEHSEGVDTEEAHRVIAESQDAAEVVYFIEGLKSKEL